MCVVSNTGDYFGQRLPNQYPWIQPWINPAGPTPTTQPAVVNPVKVPGRHDLTPLPTREEFDALKREVEIMRDLLKRAKEYDKATGQPDCEIDAKVDLIKKIAQLVGLSLEDVFPNKKQEVAELPLALSPVEGVVEYPYTPEQAIKPQDPVSLKEYVGLAKEDEVKPYL